MRVLHLIPRFSTGGAERLVLSYAKHMREYGIEPVVASTVDGGELKGAFYATQVLTFVFSRHTDGGRVGALIKLLKMIWRERPEIVHTHLLGADIVGFLVRLIAPWRVRWVVTLHNVETNTALWRRLLWRCILPHADAVIAVGGNVAVYAKAAFTISEKKLYTIPNGIDRSAWVQVPDARREEGPLRLAMIGRLDTQKGHTYLFEALSRLPKQSWHLSLFGGGELESALRAEAEKKGIASSITWEGIVPDVSVFLRDIDVVVQPSLWEGLSLVVLEALSSGRAVIGTPAAGSEIFTDGVEGFIVPAKDSTALALALQKCIENKEMVVSMGRAARARSNQFSLEHHLEQVKNLYTHLI